MRSSISTWEGALSEIIFKKSLFHRESASPQPGRACQQPTTAHDDIKGATRVKSEEQYTMLVESDVRGSVHGILP